MGKLTDKTPPKHDSLEQYFADDAATDALALLDSDPNSARDALLLVAGYIQRGEALPGNLAAFLVDAIEAAMAKPPKLRAKALTDELGLTTNNARPAGDKVKIALEAYDRIKATKGKKKEEAYATVGQQHSINAKTVTRYLEEAKPAVEEFDAKYPLPEKRTKG